MELEQNDAYEGVKNKKGSMFNDSEQTDNAYFISVLVGPYCREGNGYSFCLILPYKL